MPNSSIGSHLKKTKTIIRKRPWPKSCAFTWIPMPKTAQRCISPKPKGSWKGKHAISSSRIWKRSWMSVLSITPKAKTGWNWLKNTNSASKRKKTCRFLTKYRTIISSVWRTATGSIRKTRMLSIKRYVITWTTWSNCRTTSRSAIRICSAWIRSTY